MAIFKKSVGVSTINKNVFKENDVALKLKKEVDLVEKENQFENNKKQIVIAESSNLNEELKRKYEGIDVELIEILEKGICTFVETKVYFIFYFYFLFFIFYFLFFIFYFYLIDSPL